METENNVSRETVNNESIEKQLDLLTGKNHMKYVKLYANNDEARKFRELWCSYVDHHGYNEKAEQYLMKGYKYCGYEPFVEEMLRAKDPEQFLMNLYRGKKYSAPSYHGHRILFYLLAAMINLKAPNKYKVDVIRRIPKSILTVEGVRKKNIEQDIVICFIKFLDLSVAFDFDTIRPLLDRDSIDTLLNILQEGLDNLSAGDEKQQKYIDHCRAMFHLKPAENKKSPVSPAPAQENKATEKNEPVPETKPAPAAAEKVESLPTPSAQTVSAQHASAETVKKDEAKAPEKPVEQAEETKQQKQQAEKPAPEQEPKKQPEKPQQKKPAAPEYTTTDIMKFLDVIRQDIENLKESKEENNRVQAKLRSQEALIAELEGNLKRAHEETERQSREIEILKQSNLEIGQKNKELQSSGEALQAELEESRKQVEKLQELNQSAVQNEHRKAQENLNRIGSRLQVEYDDYREIMEEPMTTDLGDNLRLQLGSVFDILKNSGIQVK